MTLVDTLLGGGLDRGGPRRGPKIGLMSPQHGRPHAGSSALRSRQGRGAAGRCWHHVSRLVRTGTSILPGHITRGGHTRG